MRNPSFAVKILVTAALVLTVLIVAPVSNAADVVFDPTVLDKAIGITNLDIDGLFYDVEFLEGAEAFYVYGEPPSFDFDQQTEAGAAVDAVNAAFNASIASMKPVNYVGQEGGAADGDLRYYIGYESVPPKVLVTEGQFVGTWERGSGAELPYIEAPVTWALFTFVGIDDVKIGGRVYNLDGEGLELELQINGFGEETLPITGNVPFEFTTLLVTGDTYKVTVETQPSNHQQCSVARGSGTAATEDITNVIVACIRAEPLADVRVFVTSTDYDGDLGGLAGADDECQAAADTAGLGGGPWIAWLSDSTGDAIDRIPNGRYRLLDVLAATLVLDDTVVALDKDDLLSGPVNLRNLINIDEFGQERWAKPYTGTNVNGTANPDHCNNWTDNTAEASGRYGTNDQTDMDWTTNGTGQCTDARALYCFGEPAPAAAPTAAFLPAIYRLLRPTP